MYMYMYTHTHTHIHTHSLTLSHPRSCLRLLLALFPPLSLPLSLPFSLTLSPAFFLPLSLAPQSSQSEPLCNINDLASECAPAPTPSRTISTFRVRRGIAKALTLATRTLSRIGSSGKRSENE